MRILTRTPFPGQPSVALSCDRPLCRGLNLNEEGWGQFGSAASSPLYGDAALALPELLEIGMIWGFLDTPQISSLQPMTCPPACNSSSSSYPKCFPLAFLIAISSLLPHSYTNGTMGTVRRGWDSCQTSFSATKRR